VIGGGIDAIRHDVDRQSGNKALQRVAVSIGDGNNPVGAPAGGSLESAQATPLEKRVGGGVPAPGEAEVGLKGTPLEEEFGIVVIKDDQGARDGALDERQIRGQLDALDLDDIEGVKL
jgi:hypothetical protein